MSDLTSLEEGDARILSQGKNISAFAFSPNGSTLAAADRKGEIHRFDPSTGESKGVFPSGDAWVPSLIYTPDGQQLIGGGGDGVVRVWQPETGEVLAAYPLGKATLFATLTKNGSTLLAQLHRSEIIVLRANTP